MAGSAAGRPRSGYRAYPPGMGPEEAFVRAFVARNRRQRWLDGLADPAKRGAVLDRLHPFNDFVTSYCENYHATGLRDEEIVNIVAMLRERGANELCHVLSPDQAVDGTPVTLTSALSVVLGWHSAVLICIPDRLALYLSGTPSDPIVLSRPKHG